MRYLILFFIISASCSSPNYNSKIKVNEDLYNLLKSKTIYGLDLDKLSIFNTEFPETLNAFNKKIKVDDGYKIRLLNYIDQNDLDVELEIDWIQFDEVFRDSNDEYVLYYKNDVDKKVNDIVLSESVFWSVTPNRNRNKELYNILVEKGLNLPSGLDRFNQMIEEDERLRNNLSSFIEQNSLDITLEFGRDTTRIYFIEPYIDGLKSGVEKHYTDKGVIFEEIQFTNGKKHGINNKYRYDDNSIQMEIIWKEGKEITTTCYSRNGDVCNCSNIKLIERKSLYSVYDCDPI